MTAHYHLLRSLDRRHVTALETDCDAFEHAL